MSPILQVESGECGLACLAMICAAHGKHQNVSELRRKFSVSLKGVTLRDLISHAAALNFSSRPLRLELEELANLRLPCILHWDLNHFVVLRKVSGRSVYLMDPAVGERKVSFAELSRHFTGVALELSPNAEFKSVASSAKISLRQLTGNVYGLKRSLLQIFAIAVTLELFSIVAPLFNQLVVDEVLGSGDVELLAVLVIGFGLLLVTQTAIGLVRSWMVIVLSQTLSLQWMGNVFSHLLRLPVPFFERRHLGDIASRFGAIGAIQKTLTTTSLEAILDGLMALASFAMMLLYAPSLSIVVVCAVIFYGLLRWIAYYPLRDAAAERLVLAARENTHFLETLRAITPLKLFGHEEQRYARWQNLITEVQNRDIRTAVMGMVFGTSNAFIFGLENLLVLWLGATTIIEGQVGGGVSMTIGMLFAFLSYKMQFATRLSALINFAIELKMLSLHAERLADIVLETPEHAQVQFNDLQHLEPNIELRDVSYRYSDGEPWILRHASIRLNAGDSVVITGPSGTGKTTLLKIALALLEPTEGEVRYGGVAVKKLGIANFRRQVGAVMQEDVLLTGTLADNVSFFDAEIDMARVEACGRLAQIHDEIAVMPMGYETLVGDLGSGLSGGQKQRLLLARALYKRPRILALDEATSHLDIQNETAVVAALGKLDITRLVIAHRPETVASARRVFFLSDGVVSELGCDGAPTSGGTVSAA